MTRNELTVFEWTARHPVNTGNSARRQLDVFLNAHAALGKKLIAIVTDPTQPSVLLITFEMP